MLIYVLLGLRLSNRITAISLLSVQEEKTWGLLGKVRQPQLKSSLMDECLELWLQCVHPFHGIKWLETWMFHWLLDVRKRIESQKFRCFRKFGSPTVQIVFKVDLLSFLFLFRSLSKVLIVVRVENVDYEVQMQIEFQLFCHKVSSKHVLWDQHLPSFEELIFLTSIKGWAQLIQQCFRVIVQSIKYKISVSINEEWLIWNKVASGYFSAISCFLTYFWLMRSWSSSCIMPAVALNPILARWSTTKRFRSSSISS